jgi:beta-galactosidase
VAGLESTVRLAPDGTRLRFLLNHGTEPVSVSACESGTDLLTGNRVAAGAPLRLDPYGVVLLAQ